MQFKSLIMFNIFGQRLLNYRHDSIFKISEIFNNSRRHASILLPSKCVVISRSSSLIRHPMASDVKVMTPLSYPSYNYSLSTTSADTSTTTATTNNISRVRKSSKPSPSLLRRLLTKIGLLPSAKHRLKITSHLLYESVADRINYMFFFETFKLPNTFNTWFLITELHVWMLLLRAMAEGAETNSDGRFLRNCIVEAMWGDVNVRATKLGSYNKSRNRQQIEELSEQFQAALLAYDEGIMSEDRVLAGALWRRFFAMNCDDCVQIERLVKYVRYQVAILDQTPHDEFMFRPKIQWLELKNIHV